MIQLSLANCLTVSYTVEQHLLCHLAVPFPGVYTGEMKTCKPVRL